MKKYSTIYLFNGLMTSNSAIMHITKVHFIQLVRKIKYVEFEDRPDKFFLKSVRM